MDYELEDGEGRRGKLSIPDCMIEKHLSQVKELGEIESREEYEGWYRKNYEDWESHITDYFMDRLIAASGNLVPKEEALFLENWYLSKVPPEGGHPKRLHGTFEDDGEEYGMLTFFWSGPMEEEHTKPYMVAYKEGDQ